MSGIEAAGLALQVFDVLYTTAKLIKRAADDFNTAESQFTTLLEDIEQCERYATIVMKCLQQIPSNAMVPSEQDSIKKQLNSILKRGMEFKKWTQENMIGSEEKKLKQLQKKFKVAFGKLRKIDSDLRAQVDKLRKVAPEITMQLQSLVLDVVLKNQGEIATLHLKMDSVIEKLSRLSNLIEQPLPAYNDVAFNSIDIGETWDEKADSESSYADQEASDYPQGSFGARNIDSHPNLYEVPSDEDLDFSDKEENYGLSINRGRSHEESNQQESAPWAARVVAVSAVASVFWLSVRFALRH